MSEEQNMADPVTAFDEMRNAVPLEWLAPAKRFAHNDYPCPRCGQQLPQYGQGVHLC